MTIFDIKTGKTGKIAVADFRKHMNSKRRSESNESSADKNNKEDAASKQSK